MSTPTLTRSRDRNRGPYTVPTGVAALVRADFTVAPAQRCPGAYVAVFEQAGFRVRVTVCPLRDHQLVALSRVVDGRREHLVLRTGRFRNHVWVPFSVTDAVRAALSMAREIGGLR